jgi:elongation factor Tu
MSSFSKVFLRTSRAAVQYQRGVSPVQNALGAHGTSRWMNGVRNYAAFTRDKPHVNIGMPPASCHQVGNRFADDA